MTTIYTEAAQASVFPAPARNDASAVAPFPLSGSSYGAFDGEKLRPARDGEVIAPVAEFVHDSFRALVTNARFTCVAAKSAFNKNNYRFGVYEYDLASPDVTAVLARDLRDFVAEQDTLRATGFSTFVASFTGPAIADELQFENLLWTQLQALHDADSDAPWDPTVSANPDEPEFEFSFAGRAFFVVGMHPGSNRLTRRFAFPTLALNAHFQFEELRENGKYGRMQEVIRGRDITLQGSINANLADFGERSDARQYSGRIVEDEWRCPFRSRAVAAPANLDGDKETL